MFEHPGVQLGQRRHTDALAGEVTRLHRGVLVVPLNAVQLANQAHRLIGFAAFALGLHPYGLNKPAARTWAQQARRSTPGVATTAL
jgi:hypothetical protein